MATHLNVALVTTPTEVLNNIERFQKEILQSRELHGLLSTFQAWYAYKNEEGLWLYGPAKFVAGVGLTSQNYRELGGQIDIRVAEKLLSPWFGIPLAVAEDAHLEELSERLSRFGRTLSENARVMTYRPPVMKPIVQPGPTAPEQVDALLVLYRAMDMTSQAEFRRRLALQDPAK